MLPILTSEKEEIDKTSPPELLEPTIVDEADEDDKECSINQYFVSFSFLVFRYDKFYLD